MYKTNLKEWTPRKPGYSIGRLFYTPPESGERHYLHTLLNIVKGAATYEEIRIVNGVVHNTFRLAMLWDC